MRRSELKPRGIFLSALLTTGWLPNHYPRLSNMLLKGSALKPNNGYGRGHNSRSPCPRMLILPFGPMKSTKKKHELDMFCRNIARHKGSPARADSSGVSDHMHKTDRG
ncbi:hypothetical protein DAI22_11g239500 [Oryza sativa Japonica Group]|nr:hypothetical protein DAI22_11g239500 [Oryza sativa Japonica Group]